MENIKEINVEKYERWLEENLEERTEETLERIARLWSKDSLPQRSMTRIEETIGQELANAFIGFYENDVEKQESIEYLMEPNYDDGGEENISEEEALDLVNNVILESHGVKFFRMV